MDVNQELKFFEKFKKKIWGGGGGGGVRGVGLGGQDGCDGGGVVRWGGVRFGESGWM